MMGVLLPFITAQRDSILDLDLDLFRQMLPYCIDIITPTIPGVMCLAQMIQLPVEVLHQFQHGNSVVKGSDGRFNQVDPAHSRSG